MTEPRTGGLRSGWVRRSIRARLTLATGVSTAILAGGAAWSAMEYLADEGSAGRLDTEQVEVLQVTLWLAALTLTALATAATWILTGRALRPVERLITDLDALDAAEGRHRLEPPTTDDEIARLAGAMNGLLERLESEDHRRRQFTADVSHELRTPLAVLTSAAEVAQHTHEEHRLADVVLSETEQLRTIVDALMTLAQHDEPTTRRRTELVDLDDVVLLEAGRPRRLRIDHSGVSAGRVLGDPEELRTMTAQLLDNAARHATSTVWVGVETGTEHVVLTVDDDGAGIDPSERARVFERFVRLDEARSRDAGGAGLGLAVVAAIASAHGGAVEVGSSPQGGARFVVRLPAATDD